MDEGILFLSEWNLMWCFFFFFKSEEIMGFCFFYLLLLNQEDLVFYGRDGGLSG